MATLTVTQTTDFRPPPQETNIDHIAFDGPLGTGVTATFSTTQFVAGQIGPALAVTGGASQDHLRILAPANGTSAHAFSATDWIFIDWGVNDRVTIVGDENIIGIAGSRVADVIYGRNAAYNSLFGGNGNDVIYGNALAINRLDGGEGADTLHGGNGNDTYILDSAGDVFFETGTGGRDTVEASFSFSLQDHPGIEDLVLRGTATTGTGNDGGNLIESLLAVTLSGLGGNDRLRAGSGSALTGGEGNDYLEASGASTLNGGAGNDFYEMETDAVIVEDAGPAGGIDTASVSLDGDSFTLPDTVENMRAAGSGTAFGNAHDNYIRSEAADDLTIAGGDGDDTYDFTDESWGDWERPIIIEGAGAESGTDLVMITRSEYTMPSNVENALAGYYTADEINPLGTDIIGNDLDNWIRSDTDAPDSFHGGAGDDRLETGDYDDTLEGGAGNDTLIGGTSSDIYVNPDASDLIVETDGPYGGDQDEIWSATSFSMSDTTAFVEALRLTGTGDTRGEGNSFANLVIGNSGANLLKGWAGNDTLDGNDGVDTLRGGEGHDTLRGGAGADKLFGEDGNDSLDGGTGFDVLQGGAGNDTLNGSTHHDTLIGGAGNDTYLADGPNGVIIELAGGGVDTVVTAYTGSLANRAEVENLVITGAGNYQGDGNDSANTITGGAGANLLKGWAGYDTVYGGLGNDTLRGGEGRDRLAGEEGADMLFGEADRDYLLGGAEADQLNGGDDADQLFGEDGNDTLIGGLGNDTLLGGAGADVFRFAPGATGGDRIDGFSTAEDRFDLPPGESFTDVLENNGNTRLTHDGGTIVIAGVTGLTLAQWNALILPEASSAAGVTDAFDSSVWSAGAPAAFLHLGPGEWAFA